MPITISGSGTITGASTLATTVVNPTFTTQTAAIIKSAAVNTPTVFQDSAGTEVATMCRSWVNFSGVTSTSIQASFNVSSVTYNSTGEYTVNFTTPFADAKYSAVAATGRSSTTAATQQQPSVHTYTTASVKVASVQGSTRAFSDASEVSVAVFR